MRRAPSGAMAATKPLELDIFGAGRGAAICSDVGTGGAAAKISCVSRMHFQFQYHARDLLDRWSADLGCAPSMVELRVGTFPCAALGAFLLSTVSSAHAQNKTFDCLLEPRQKIKLATHVAGVLKEVAVDRGDVVQKGDVLARLESGVEQALLELAQARAESDAIVKAREARLKFLTKKRERILQLQAKGAASAAALDEVESEYGIALQEVQEAKWNMQIARLDVARAAEVLKQRSILSPIDGVVAERNLFGGEYAYEQAHIMTIAQINPLNVEVFVPVALYGTINMGMEAVVSAEQPVGSSTPLLLKSWIH
jgi:RND family efflux transporter MFP subunit